MKRILFILPQTQQGGAETQMMCLLKGLNKKKFEVYLGLLYENEQLKEEFESIKGIKIIHFKKRGALDLGVFLKIIKVIKRYDIGLVQTFLGNQYAYIPALFCHNVTAIGGIRDTGRPNNVPFFTRFTKFTVPKLISNQKKLILVSNCYAGKGLYCKLGFSEESIEVIPNGIDFEKFANGRKDKIVKEFNLKKKFVLGIVSRLVEVKDHKMLIYVLHELNNDYHNIVLLIVGDGPLMGNLKNLTENLKLNNVIFTGSRKDTPELLKSMDIFLFPSKMEGWPNAVGEAMAAGVPVIASSVGDIEYVVKHDYNGIIIDPNINSLKREIVKLMDDKKKMKRLSENGKRTIRENFQIKKMIESYEYLYENSIPGDD